MYKEFSGKKRLLHFTVASGDIQSVEHVLSLGADVNCMTARGYTPLIIAVLHRSVRNDTWSVTWGDLCVQ